jgi:glutathione synthase/RimK-type ligase-like ATP-grasp enzyme
VKALDDIGIDSQPGVWSDAGVDWLAFDALVFRTPWDYFARLAEFRPWLDARIKSGVRMINAREIIEWNFDKRYLRDLAQAGVSVIPTVVVRRGEPVDVVALARAQGWEEIVIKPSISGSAYLTHRFRLEDAAKHHGDVAQILRDRDLLIQPFLPEIMSDGELSLLFFDGVFSHAIRKRAKKGEYRVQFDYGGTNENAEVTPEWIDGARACIAAAPSLPAYARVDGVIHQGKFVLMELEIFEPLLYLARHPEAPARFAQSIARRLSQPGRTR